jgi:hypothetical protein
MNYEKMREYFEEFEMPEDEMLPLIERARLRAFREKQRCYELKYDFLAKAPLSSEQAVRVLQAALR